MDSLKRGNAETSATTTSTINQTRVILPSAESFLQPSNTLIRLLRRTVKDEYNVKDFRLQFGDRGEKIIKKEDKDKTLEELGLGGGTLRVTCVSEGVCVPDGMEMPMGMEEDIETAVNNAEDNAIRKKVEEVIVSALTNNTQNKRDFIREGIKEDPDSVITCIETDNKELKEQCIQAVKKWFGHRPGATYKDLVKDLRAIHLNDKADEIERILKKKNVDVNTVIPL